MAKRYDYRILPQTWKARVLLFGAFVAGLCLMVGYFALFFVGAFGPFNALGIFGKIDITYENRTQVTVVVYVNDRVELTVPAGKSVVQSDLKLLWWSQRKVVAKDQSGRIIFAVTLDKDDLEKAGYRIIIDDH
jgi:hypothetical protein